MMFQNLLHLSKREKMKKFIAIGLLLFSTLAQASVWQQEIRWDWQKINLDDTPFWQSLNLPKNFSWGVASSAFRLEGTQTYNGHAQNNFTVHNPELQNNSMFEHWDRYKEDVQLIKNAGLNTFRYSIAWEKIEPTMGIYDEVAMQHYKDEIKELKENGIDPWICLFHFKMPVWFYDMGGFERKENLVHFIKFCKYVFENLNQDVTYWSVYNEPIAYAVEAYHTGKKPPFQKGVMGLIKACAVVKNMLKAHIEIYQQCKKINNKAQIGLIKMFHILDHYSGRFIENYICKFGNYLTNDSVLDFFKTGNFNWMGGLTSYCNQNAPQCLDFIGVNYYTHSIMKCKYGFDFKRKTSRENEQQIMEGPRKGRSIYPEGLYRSIVKAAELNLPIFITENGIATPDENQRNEFIKQHLYVVQKAINDGFDIRGYHYWTLLDLSAYGIYEVDMETQKRTLRSGAQPFVNFLRTQKR